MGEAERDRQEQIARRAFEIYESRGREGGHDLEDWQEAERQVAATTEMQVAETGTPEELAPAAQVSGESGQQFRSAPSPEESPETLNEELGYTQGQAE
jgi:Protein of unknown function (DUF2934)